MLRRIVQSLAREPSTYFFVVGGLLFLLSPKNETPAAPIAAASTAESNGALNRRIEVTPAVREHLRRGLLEINSVPPSTEELTEATERWLDTEVLYREGLALGLDREDPVVRLRVASQMRYFLERRALAEPEDAELRRFFEQNSETYLVEPRIDFEHVFVRGTEGGALARAEQLLLSLTEGAAPGELGDEFPRGRSFRRRRQSEIIPGFGKDFAESLFRMPLGTWTSARSNHGFHVVRVTRRSGDAQPSFDDVSQRVLAEWKLEAISTNTTAAIGNLRSRYEIVRTDRDDGTSAVEDARPALPSEATLGTPP